MPACYNVTPHAKTQAMLLPTFPKIDIDPNLLERLVTVVNAAADAASVPTAANFRRVLEIEDKHTRGSFDPVTVADREAELAIKAVVQKAFPEHGFLGEEFGEELGKHLSQDDGRASRSDQLIWIVDPIDGTRAYITGMPLWGSLIAVYDGLDVVLGVLEQPILKERYFGVQCIAGGVSNNSSELITPSGRQTLSTRKTSRLAQAIVQTTTPDFFSEEEHAGVFQTLKESVSMVRYGGDCYCYALLASGFVDVVIERQLEPYDIAALIPIVQGAGGVVSDWSGGSAASGGAVVASANPALHDKVLKLLSSA